MLAAVGGAMLLAGQALATTCPTGTQGSPVCISPTSSDGSGAGLQSLMNTWVKSGTVPNVYTNQVTPSAFWSIGSSGSSGNQIILELAGNAGSNSFGIFDPTANILSTGLNATNSLTLFNGADGAGTKTSLLYNGGGNFQALYGSGAPDAFATFGAGNKFGYFLNTPNGTFYSLPSMNENGTNTYYPNGVPHMVAFVGNNQTVAFPVASCSPTCKWLPNEYIMAWEDKPFSSSDLDYNDFIVSVESVHPVPEPAVLGMFGLGLIGILFAVEVRRRKQHQK